MRALAAGLCSLFVAAGWLVSADQTPATPPSFSYAEPGISPDGHEIAFESGGAIWSVPATGGDAHLLVADGATDRRPLFSPDGKQLAFVSTRTGGGDIYVLTLATGEMKRLTADDGLEALDNWSRDGHWIYFSTTAHDIAGMNDIYRVAIDGGTPMAVSEDRYVNEFEGVAAAATATRLAFIARGVASINGGGGEQSSRSVRDLDAGSAGADRDGRVLYALSPMGARQAWPMWSGDGRDLFYVSDRGGAENVSVRPATAAGADSA